MLHRRLHIGEWVYDFYFSVSSYWLREIQSKLINYGAPNSILRRVSRNIRKGNYNYGFTYSNGTMKRGVVVIGLTDSGPEFINSFCHELRHLTDDIGRVDGLELAGEPIAYLAGDIAQALSDVVCTHCHRTHR